jgi:hypothetical protein
MACSKPPGIHVLDVFRSLPPWRDVVGGAIEHTRYGEPSCSGCAETSSLTLFASRRQSSKNQ